MHPRLQALVALQDLDSRIEKTESALGLIPGCIAREKARLEEYEAAVADGAAAAEAARKRQRELEGEVQSADQQLRDTRGKQALVKTNEEYRALTREIESLEARVRSLEDAVLEVMEGLPGLDEKAAAARKELEQAEGVVRAAVERHEREGERLRKELDVLMEERRRATGDVEGEWLARYDRLRRGRGGLAVCPIIEQACQGCRMSETLQRFFEIRDSEEEIFTCSSCGRILYYRDAETVSAAPRADGAE